MICKYLLPVILLCILPYLTYSQADPKKQNTDSSFVKTDTVKKKISDDSANAKIKKVSKTKSKSDTVLIKEIHAQDSPDKSGFFIESKDRKSNIRILGSIRLFGSYDFNGLKGGTSFAISEIPVGEDKNDENTFFLTANITRLGLESNLDSKLGKTFMRLETDFNGSGNQFRIRHAYGQGEFLLAGQTWTVFSDIQSIPITVDLEGPPTSISLRTVQIRYYTDFGKKLHFKVSVEAPNVSIAIPDSVILEPVTQKFPDIAVNLKTEMKYFDFTVAGVYKSISARSIYGNLESLKGGGGLLSGNFKIFKDTKFNFQILYGLGVSSYLNISNNNSVDVILNSQSGQYELITSSGGFLSLGKSFFNKVLDVNFIFGQVKFSMKDYFAGNTFEKGQYLAVNTFLSSGLGFRLGLEYTYGFKRTKDGSSANANRAAFTFYYNF